MAMTPKFQEKEKKTSTVKHFDTHIVEIVHKKAPDKQHGVLV